MTGDWGAVPEAAAGLAAACHVRRHTEGYLLKQRGLPASWVQDITSLKLGPTAAHSISCL